MIGNKLTKAFTLLTLLFLLSSSMQFIFSHESSNLSYIYSSSSYTEPTVAIANENPPTLTNGQVYPTIGYKKATRFTFSVNYTDADNNTPDYVNVTINGTSHIMNKQDGFDSNYTDGCIYESIILLNETGSYTYHFTCSDGIFPASLGTQVGPTVENCSLFESMYINHTFTNSTGGSGPSSFVYSFNSGHSFNATWTYWGETWDVDVRNRIIENTTSWFGNNNHTPAWIFTNISLGDSVLIAVNSEGDHTFNVSDEFEYQLSGFGPIEVLVLEDLTTPGGIAWYEKSTGILLNGTFYYNGTSQNYTYDFVNTNVEFSYIPNYPPELTPGFIAPLIYNQTSLLNFTVNYTDKNNDVPEYVNVLINGTSYPMEKQNSSDEYYIDGCLYRYLIYLQPGTYNYSYECSDGALYNSTSTYFGINIVGINSNSPTLINGQVDPVTGWNGVTYFAFTVNYTDTDNNAPNYMNVTINGTSYSMTQQDIYDSNYSDGCLYLYNTTLNVVGNYSYYFNCSDGSFPASIGPYSNLMVEEVEQLVILMPTPSKYVDPYVDKFKIWYYNETNKPIDVTHVRKGGVECIEYVEEQGGNPNEDVIASMGYNDMDRLRLGGYLDPYQSPNAIFINDTYLETIPGKNPDGYFTGFSYNALGIMVNNDTLQNNNLSYPTGYRDLAFNHSYKDFIIMGSPVLGTIAHTNIQLILFHYGWIQGWNITLHLASLIDDFTDTTGTANSLTAAGDYAAVLTKDSYWWEYTVQNYSVGWVWPDEGSYFRILHTGILSGAKNEQNAQFWVDWMLSKEGQEAWIDCRYEGVLRSDITLPPGMHSMNDLANITEAEPNYRQDIEEARYDTVTDICTNIIGYHGELKNNYDDEEVLEYYLNLWVIKPQQEAQKAIELAKDTINLAFMMPLSDQGLDFLIVSINLFNHAKEKYSSEYNYEQAASIAKDADYYGKIAMLFPVQPPVWLYYVIITIIVIASFVIILSVYLKRRQLEKHSKELEVKVKERTSELSKEKQRIETIIETVPNGILVLESDGSLYLSNRIFRRYYQKILQEKIHQDFNINETPSIQLFDTIRKLITSKDPEPITIEPYKGLYLKLYSAPLESRTKKPFGFIIELNDVTPFVEFDNQRKQFVSTVSHELRTPISAIIQSLNNIKKYGDRMQVDTRNKLMNILDLNADLLAQMIEDLLLVSRIDEKRIKLEWKKYNLKDLLNEVLYVLEPKRREKEIEITLEADNDILLFGDQKRIGQIFRNLVDNAIKYSPKGSKIVVKTIDNYLGKYNQLKKEGVLIQVIDNGRGIHKDEISHLFQRFFRSDEIREISGTGLGLSIARDLARNHQGEIFVDSEYGKGSTFSVFLPRIP